TLAYVACICLSEDAPDAFEDGSTYAPLHWNFRPLLRGAFVDAIALLLARSGAACWRSGAAASDAEGSFQPPGSNAGSRRQKASCERLHDQRRFAMDRYEHRCASRRAR